MLASLVAALVGILFLADHTRPGLTIVAVAGFILAVACAVALARFGEASDERGAGRRHRGPGPRRERAEHLDRRLTRGSGTRGAAWCVLAPGDTGWLIF